LTAADERKSTAIKQKSLFDQSCSALLDLNTFAARDDFSRLEAHALLRAGPG
jgi:hypothetical protein